MSTPAVQPSRPQLSAVGQVAHAQVPLPVAMGAISDEAELKPNGNAPSSGHCPEVCNGIMAGRGRLVVYTAITAVIGLAIWAFLIWVAWTLLSDLGVV